MAEEATPEGRRRRRGRQELFYQTNKVVGPRWCGTSKEGQRQDLHAQVYYGLRRNQRRTS